ncbi:MetQ/NlpA family ABC transporter substrate-binding protein [Alcaligenes nematophilus]|uniref:MetQ/NlpA family ABC transporter substrate-binding protein n=1 Tax=Alcaligenes nematophilus TaxID=2994643 RepID=A0ABU3MW02_9BURK|nr:MULTISPECIES: MetQ/NlpA family ABC transporter substrate-binding protein [Alcaligenes]MCB4322683.1 MetQ/NlpA family ABC transporter substrate-binding protein [Alcaligenes sp. 13f]MDT8465319.1 MetQ/NlpA family ABC transporter substrate-binding protein [Alcaligenes nematophilus]MDT8470234.1 MetQ/NlpA family ABC transporter substrate-binding protein [Alcaligenes nematophilus]MDT8505921.1 MetQ/NlpA family ABC transporter substrate-binding protein [Alcaligenes nematophilus]MDT8526539.1 MetQ/NlpA
MLQHLSKLIVASALVLAVSPAIAADSLRIGVVPGAYADSINAAAKDAKAQGINVEVIEFTDWTTPNVAVDNGDIDINYFQHQPFLKNAIEKNGYKLASAGTGILANVGVYSLKHQAVDQVPQGGKVGIANDPVNQGRGLLLLQKVGLIKLKPEVGYLGSLDDIVENPKKLSFVEVEGPQLVRITGDVDIAQGYPHFIVAAKAFDPSSGLAYSGIEDAQFAIQFVVKADRTNDPVIQKFISIYQNSQSVRDVSRAAFNNDERLYTLAWLNAQGGAK